MFKLKMENMVGNKIESMKNERVKRNAPCLI